MARKISEGNDPKTSAQRERIETIKQREITFRVLADAYLRPNAEHRTAAKVRRVIYDAILLPVLGDRPVIDLVASDITTLTDKIAEVGSDRALVELGIRTKLRHPERPARPTVVMARSVYVQAERVLEYAVGCGHLAKSPIAHIQKAKKFKGAVNGPRSRFHRGVGDRVVLARHSPHAQAAKAILATADADRRAAIRAGSMRAGTSSILMAAMGSVRFGRFQKRA